MTRLRGWLVISSRVQGDVTKRGGPVQSVIIRLGGDDEEEANGGEKGKLKEQQI